MQAGGTLPSRWKWKRLQRFLGLFLVLVGLVLLSAVAGYYLLSARAKASLGDLDYTAPGVDRPISQPPVAPSASTLEPQRQALFPGELIQPKFWGDPALAQSPPASQTALLEGFKPVSEADMAALGKLPLPNRMIIPAIEVDSKVAELAIVDVNDAKAYETPKFIVGHIPGTATPGERGNGWYFGHLQSPILGEGAVFRNLPQIPQRLKQGDDVYVILESVSGVTYLYKVTSTKVVLPDGIDLNPTANEPIITLVTCVPEFVYSHRLVVTAGLVGIKA